MRREKYVEKSSNAFGQTVNTYETNEDAIYKETKKERQRQRMHSVDRFFEGYETETVLTESGKTSVIRVYHGDYYHQELSAESSKKRRVGYVCLFTVSVALLFVSLCLPTFSNRCWYASVVMLVPLALDVKIFFDLISFCLAGRDFEIRRYKDELSLKKLSKWSAFSVVLIILATVVMFIVQEDSFTYLELFKFLLVVCAGISIYFIHFFESKVQYKVIKGQDKR